MSCLLRAVSLLLVLGCATQSTRVDDGDALGLDAMASSDATAEGDTEAPLADAAEPDATEPDTVDPDAGAQPDDVDDADTAEGDASDGDVIVSCGVDAPDGACPAGRVCRYGGACVVPPPGGATPPVTPADLVTRAGSTIAERYGAFAAKPKLDWVDLVSAAADAYASEDDPWERAWIAVGLGAELGDGHSGLYSTALCDAFRGYDGGVANVGACVTEVDGELVVYRRTVAAPVGLDVGDIIRGFDGRDATAALVDLEAQPRCAPAASSAAMARQRLVDSILFRAPTDASLDVEKPDGTMQTIAIEPASQANVACDGRVGPTGLTSLGAGVSVTVLDGPVFFIRLDIFGTYVGGEFLDAPVTASLRAAFEQARDYDAVILDLRANPGGYVSIYVELAAWVSAEPILLYRCRNKVGQGPDDFSDRYEFYSTPDGSLQFDGKLAILASARSFSAADFTTQWMGATGAGRARVFGAPTGGGFGSGPATDLGDGWSAAINDLDCVNADDVPLEGNPPPVDVPVSYTRDDILSGVDTVLEAARAYALEP